MTSSELRTPYCLFCGDCNRTTPGYDQKGQPFYSCEWCKAHIIHNTIPKDVYDVAQRVRAFLTSVNPHATSR